MKAKRAWRGMHWPSLFLMLGLCMFGVMVIYSATHTSEAADLRNAAIQQAAWVGLGLICFFVFAMAKTKKQMSPNPTHAACWMAALRKSAASLVCVAL